MTDRTPIPAGRKTSSHDKRGIECPSCGCMNFRVLYTRRSIGGRILRRRECRNCERRVTTYEATQE